jgi:flagellar hook-length control protein FliK
LIARQGAALTAGTNTSPNPARGAKSSGGTTTSATKNDASNAPATTKNGTPDPDAAGQSAAGSQGTTNDPAKPPTASAPATPAGSDAATAAEVALAGEVEAPPSSTPTKTNSGASSNSGSDDDDKNASATGDGAVSNQTAAVASLPQPIAAAVANVTLDATATTAGASGASNTIGEPTKARAKATLLPADGSDAGSPQNAKDAANAATDSVTTSAAKGTDSAADVTTTAAKPSDTSAATQSQNANAVPQGQAFSATDTSTSQNDAPLDVAHLVARTGTGSTTASATSANASNPQGGSGPGNTIADNLATFGFSATNTGSINSAAAGSSNTNAVPISGLAVAIAARAQDGSNQFDIRLDPPELGRIDVQLSVDGSGQVTSHVTVDRPDTLTLLQNQQPQLERALEQAGLKTADNGLSFTLRDQSFAGQNNNGGGAQTQSNQAQLVIPDADLPPVSAAQAYSRLGLGGGVDITV